MRVLKAEATKIDERGLPFRQPDAITTEKASTTDNASVNDCMGIKPGPESTLRVSYRIQC